MPDQLVLPRIDAESVTIEPRGAVRTRQWWAEGLSIDHPGPSTGRIIPDRLGILTTPAAWIGCVITIVLKELADNPNAAFGFHFETASYLVVVTFLTFSSLMFPLARQGDFYRFRGYFSYIGVFNSAVDVFLGAVNWLNVRSRPKTAKESPVIAKTSEDVDTQSIFYHGVCRLNRDLRGSTHRRPRIAVR